MGAVSIVVVQMQEDILMNMQLKPGLSLYYLLNEIAF